MMPRRRRGSHEQAARNAPERHDATPLRLCPFRRLVGAKGHHTGVVTPASVRWRTTVSKIRAPTPVEPAGRRPRCCRTAGAARRLLRSSRSGERSQVWDARLPKPAPMASRGNGARRQTQRGPRRRPDHAVTDAPRPGPSPGQVPSRWPCPDDPVRPAVPRPRRARDSATTPTPSRAVTGRTASARGNVPARRGDAPLEAVPDPRPHSSTEPCAGEASV